MALINRVSEAFRLFANRTAEAFLQGRTGFATVSEAIVNRFGSIFTDRVTVTLEDRARQAIRAAEMLMDVGRVGRMWVPSVLSRGDTIADSPIPSAYQYTVNVTVTANGEEQTVTLFVDSESNLTRESLFDRLDAMLGRDSAVPVQSLFGPTAGSRRFNRLATAQDALIEYDVRAIYRR